MNLVSTIRKKLKFQTEVFSRLKKRKKFFFWSLDQWSSRPWESRVYAHSYVCDNFLGNRAYFSKIKMFLVLFFPFFTILAKIFPFCPKWQKNGLLYSNWLFLTKRVFFTFFTFHMHRTPHYGLFSCNMVSVVVFAISQLAWFWPKLVQVHSFWTHNVLK